MLNDIQNITEDIQQAKIVLKYIYKVLNQVNDIEQVEESQKSTSKQLTENTLLHVKGASLNPHTEVSTKEGNASEKEFNHKMAAHDLISPLATQFTLLDILKEDCLELKQKINNALQNINFLTISNSESIKMSKAILSNDTQLDQPIPFNKLIEDVIQLLGIRELHKHINIIVQYNSQKAFYNNMAIVQSIVQNLIQNAVKYSKPNVQNTITIIINDTAQGIEIIVQDTGIGMDKQRVDQLFEQRLSSHDIVKDSHGFGLYGVAQYVEKLNGKITVESTLHIGSTFTVSLPTLNSN